jgi:hypothetical protein
MNLNLGLALGLVLFVTVLCFVVVQIMKPTPYAPPAENARGATLPCMANGQCPVGQKCMGGTCIEGFAMEVNVGKDMSSCTAPQCGGIDAPCARRETPCPEGTFCQENKCVDIAAPDQGAAYNQIGMINLN